MLGPLAICRGDVALELPASRKARALFAYLALAPHPIARSQLCELLWDIPNDPRGELRWCLSKIRRLIDEPDRQRIRSQFDTVKLDLDDCFIDALAVTQALQGSEPLASTRLRELAAMFEGEFLAGLEIDGSPAFDAWLVAQRRRFRGTHAAVLERLVKTASDGDVFPYIEKWLELTPFDPCVHELLLRELVRRDRIGDAEEHLAAASRHFEAENLDSAPLRDALRTAKAQRNGAVTEPVQTETAAEPEHRLSRASVAVLPFVDSSTSPVRGGAADALAHDIITRLAKLRSLFIIAQGSVFALQERGVTSGDAGRMLKVDYVVSGSVCSESDRIQVMVELIETKTARIVWAEVFDNKRDGTFDVMDVICNTIVASIASEIEASERNRAILRPPNSLDAWEAHHRGLWHMYRFNKLDNERAQKFFEMSIRLDPTFARAHAGLSFTHFQNAFQGWGERQLESDRAFEAAGQSLLADDRDPAAHWAMGRALWLRGRHEESVVELEQAVEISPNFALGHYTLAFVRSQAGDPNVAIDAADLSRRLSPFDPLLFGMLGARAMALVRMGRFDEGANWGVQAAARPNAHVHILAIAALSLALAGRLDEARGYVDAIHRTLPRYGVDDFLTAMHFEPAAENLFRSAASRIGLA